MAQLGGRRWQRDPVPAQQALGPAPIHLLGSGPKTGEPDPEESDEDMYDEAPAGAAAGDPAELGEARKAWRQSKKLLKMVTGLASPEVVRLVQAQHQAAKERLDRLRPAQERMDSLRDSEASRVKLLEKLTPQIAEAKLALVTLEERYKIAEEALRKTRQEIQWCQMSMPAVTPVPAEAGPRSAQSKALLAMVTDAASAAEVIAEVAALQAHLAQIASSLPPPAVGSSPPPLPWTWTVRPAKGRAPMGRDPSNLRLGTVQLR